MLFPESPDWWRTPLLALVALGLVALPAELLLLEHTESTLQWIPLASLGVGILATAMVALRPAPSSLRLFRWVMAAFVMVGAVGIGLHLRGNYLFEREMDPETAGWPLLREMLMGATPVLAPGAMAQLGLIGLLYAFRHPLATTPPDRSD